MTTIDFNPFSGCTSLTSASFPAAETIGDNAFGKCTSLTSVSFPAATFIGTSAFASCTSLTSVSFPEVTTIDFNAFSDCTGLTSVRFPSTATVGGNPFPGCTALTSITLTDSGGALSVLEDDKALIQNGTELVAYPSASGAVTLSTITSIGASAFSGCTGLSTLDIPGVINIGPYAFQDTGTTELTITMGSTAPTLGSNMFAMVDDPKTVIVNVPNGSVGNYDAPWPTNFKGGNANITLDIRELP